MISVGFWGHFTKARYISAIFLLLDLIIILDEIILLSVHVKWCGIMWGVDLLLRPKTVTTWEPASFQEHHDLTLLSFFSFGSRICLLFYLWKSIDLWSLPWFKSWTICRDLNSSLWWRSCLSLTRARSPISKDCGSNWHSLPHSQKRLLIPFNLWLWLNGDNGTIGPFLEGWHGTPSQKYRNQ